MRRSVRILAGASLLLACGREPVEVAEELAATDASVDAQADGNAPSFPALDAAIDGPSCGNPPDLFMCPACPHGYRALADGSTACDCCP